MSRGEPSLRELRYFLAVYEHRSFSAAARSLYMSQPPLSQAVASLEKALGVSLFERTGRQVIPTPAGVALQPEALLLLRRAEELPARLGRARAVASDLPTLRLGAVSSLFTAYLAALLPHLQEVADVSVLELSSADALTELREGRLDAALTRESAGRGLREEVLLQERLFAAVPGGHDVADRGSIRLAELREEPVILFERTMAPFAFDTIATAFRQAGVPLRPIGHVRTEQAALGLVRAGQGITIVPELFTRTTWDGIAFLALEDVAATAALRGAVAPSDPAGMLPALHRANAKALSSLDLSMPLGAPSTPKE